MSHFFLKHRSLAHIVQRSLLGWRKIEVGKSAATMPGSSIADTWFDTVIKPRFFLLLLLPPPPPPPPPPPSPGLEEALLKIV